MESTTVPTPVFVRREQKVTVLYYGTEIVIAPLQIFDLEEIIVKGKELLERKYILLLILCCCSIPECSQPYART